MNNGIFLIQKEREEQVLKHGYSTPHDVFINKDYQLSKAAHMLVRDGLDDLEQEDMPEPPRGWDEYIWKRMCSKSYKERLIIAGAMIAAELDRLQAMKPEFLTNQ